MSRLMERLTRYKGKGGEWEKEQVTCQVVVIRNFLPIYLGVALCKSVGLLDVNLTEFCCCVSINLPL